MGPQCRGIGVEVAFFVQLFSTGIGCFYGLVSLQFAFCQFVVSLLVALTICPRVELQLFHVTRSTCRKYQPQFVELCVHVHLLCASLSLLGKYRAKNFLSDVAVLFQLRTLSTFHILDLAATLSILAVHLAGHHDVIDRIRRRLGWLRRGVQRYISWLVEIFLNEVLDPSDLEDQSDQILQLREVSPKTARPFSLSTTIYPTSDLLDSHNKRVVETTGNRVHDSWDDEPPQRFRLLRRVSSTVIREETRSFGAQLRWSVLISALGFRNPLFHDASPFVTVLGQALERKARPDNLGDAQPSFQSPNRGGLASRSLLSLISAVMDNLDREKTLRKAQVPRDGFEGTRGPTVTSYGANHLPSMQLPGKIQSTSVEALPDTGSSLNVIDSAFVQKLTPKVTVEPISSPPDKPLLAPDGIVIPCTGKVHLSWAFKDEEKVYHLCFYVVENCAHEVIIGNGFLKETETFEEHQNRLVYNIRPDLELHPGNLASEAQDFSCRRLLVSGAINNQSMIASLDTGCEANLISADYAKERGLTPMVLPGGNREIEFANGRKRSTLGQVEVDWRFDDDPVVVKIRCYVLDGCIHPVIFGVQFAVSEKPWKKHRSTLSWKELPDTGDAGVVGLVEDSRWSWNHRKKAIDPQAEQIKEEKKAQHDRLGALLSPPFSPTYLTPAHLPSTPSRVNTAQPGAAAAEGLLLANKATTPNQLNGHGSLTPSAAVVGAATVISAAALAPSITATASQSISSSLSSDMAPTQRPLS